jgi:large subunit ribosomal protein L29
MKNEEIREMSERQLRQVLEENRQELFNLRFQIATRKIKNHQRIPVVKRDIARVMTALRERELIREYTGVEAEPESEAAAATAKEAPRRGRGFLGRFGGGRR